MSPLRVVALKSLPYLSPECDVKQASLDRYRHHKSFVQLCFYQMRPPPDLPAVPGHGVDLLLASGQIPEDIGKLARLHFLALGSSRLSGENNRIKISTNPSLPSPLVSLVLPI